MKELTKTELKQLQSIELDILKEVDRVCRSNGIQYSLTYGTLLGAVRHGGFIPWDDDIDLMMTRPEFIKFKKIAESELGSDYYLVGPENSDDYGFFFYKVMRKGSVMRETSLSRNHAPAGIYIDIFVYDVLPDNIEDRIKQYRKAQLLKRLYICRGRYYFNQKGIRYILYRMAGEVLRILPRRMFIDWYEKNARYYEAKERMLYGELNAPSLEKGTLPCAIFENYEDIKFENFNGMTVSNYHYALEKWYGEYMVLPPEEQRVPHHWVVELRFPEEYED